MPHDETRALPRAADPADDAAFAALWLGLGRELSQEFQRLLASLDDRDRQPLTA